MKGQLLMLNEVRFASLWFHRQTQDPDTFSAEEWSELAQEALDNLDYVEKKLLKLENAPQDSKIMRRIHGALTRIYEIGWLLRLRPGVELIQQSSAFLEYARRDCLQINTSDINKLFCSVELLEELFTLRRDEKHEHPLTPSPSLMHDYEETLQWLHKQLEEVEAFQKSRMEQVEPRLGDLLVAQGAITRSALHQAIAQQRSAPSPKNDEPLGEYLVKTGQVSRQKVEEVLNLQQRFRRDVQGATSIDGQELLELSNLSGDLKATLHCLRNYIKNQHFEDSMLEHLNQHLESLSQNLSERVRSFSKQPTQHLFSKIELMTQEFSRRFEREVELILETNVSSFERSRAEALKEILLHLVRNAVEHGFESPQERLLKRKSEKGRIRIEVSNQESNLLISIEDDGRGFDKQTILQEALRGGLLQENDPLDDQTLATLFFEQGFAVEHLGKPGYGLDKVARYVRDLKGDLQLKTLKRGGCLFTISLPLPPSFLHGLIVSQRGQRYLLPSSTVRDVIVGSEAELHPLTDDEYRLFWESRTLPVKKLQVQTSEAHFSSSTWQVVSVDKSIPKETPSQGFYIILDNANNPIALHVEEIHKVSTVELQFVGSSFLRDPLIGGGGFSKDEPPSEHLIWIIDPTKLQQDTPLA